MHIVRRSAVLLLIVPCISILCSAPTVWGATSRGDDSAGVAAVGPPRLSGTNVFGWGYSGPDAIASDGTDVWVANSAGNSVVELEASNGAFVRELTGSRYAFTNPTSIVTNGVDVWVLNNEPQGTITEFSATTGSLVRIIGGDHPNFVYPHEIALDGTNLWATSYNSVFEFSEATGAFVRELAGSTFQFNEPFAITTSGSDVWVANASTPTGRGSMGASITEVAQGDGSLVRIISGVNLDDPRGLAANGADLWVSNEGNDTVTELSAAHGTLVRTLEGSVYGFKGPLGIAEDAGGRLWVTNASSNSVSEVEASTGAFIRSIQVANVANSIPTAVATDGTSVWVALEQSNTVTEIDGSTGSVTLSEAGSTYGFNAPTEIAANASTVWVGSGGVVTALDASTGALRYRKSDGQYPDEICFGLAVVGPYLWDLAWQDKPVLVETDGATGRVLRRIQGPADGLNAPLSIASGLGRIWVGNYGAHTITELNGSSGRLIAVIQLPRGALHPRELASDGRHLWLANTNSVSEMSEFTGKTIRIIKSTRLGDGDTDEIVGSSTDVFATGEVTKKITEISTASGAVVRIFHGAPSWWHRVLTANANGIWVITGSYALVEYSATSGAVRAMLDGAALGFDGPTAAAVSGGQVWVANYDGDSVTEIPAG